MFSSSLLELFGGRIEAGASGPNVVDEQIVGGWVNGDFGIDGKSSFGLGEASLAVTTDLDGVGVA